MSEPLPEALNWQVAYGKIQLQLGHIEGQTAGIKEYVERIDHRQQEMAKVIAALAALTPGGVVQQELRNDKELADQLVGAWLRAHIRTIAFVVVVVLVSVSVGLVSIDVGKAHEVREALETAAVGSGQ